MSRPRAPARPARRSECSSPLAKTTVLLEEGFSINEISTALLPRKLLYAGLRNYRKWDLREVARKDQHFEKRNTIPNRQTIHLDPITIFLTQGALKAKLQ